MNLLSGYRDVIWLRKMFHANNNKRETSHDGRNRTIRSRKNQNVRRKGNIHVLGNIGSGHNQISGDKIKK